VAHAKAKPGVGIAWPYLKGLLLNAVYGGRVDDAYDAKVGCNLESACSYMSACGRYGGKVASGQQDLRVTSKHA
jgi:hypothetical protein